MTAICVRCKAPKDINEFNWQNFTAGIRSRTCRGCRKGIRKQWYEEHKAEHRATVRRSTRIRMQQAKDLVWNYLVSHPCVDCSEADPVVLEFDHVRGRKHKSVSEMCSGGTCSAKIQLEIEKCDVRCANCHRRRTAKHRGHYRVFR